jgi:hypothetical protein
MIICYGHYHTCHLAAGHPGDCQSGTGPEHTSAMRHGDIVTSVTAVYEVLRSLGGNKPSWLDDHRAQELRTFRARFTDPQWQLFRAGYCSHPVDGGLCAVTRRHGRVLCDQHTREVRQATWGDWEPSATSVPSAVSSMDISEVP